MSQTKRQIRKRLNRYRSGMTMIEMIVAMAINVVVMIAVGALLVGGNKTWQNTYDSANEQIKRDALATTVAFGSMGRKANRLDYTIYEVNGDTFIPAVAKTSGEEVVSGDAVEFRYWDVELDKSDSYNLLDVSKTATAYALFYIEDEKLKLDHGPYPPGAVADGGGYRNTSGVTTTILAENVSDNGSDLGAFSHTTLNGIGQGSVRTNIVLEDPDDSDTVRIMTATLLRNIWPR